MFYLKVVLFTLRSYFSRSVSIPTDFQFEKPLFSVRGGNNLIFSNLNNTQNILLNLMFLLCMSRVRGFIWIYFSIRPWKLTNLKSFLLVFRYIRPYFRNDFDHETDTGICTQNLYMSFVPVLTTFKTSPCW